MRTLNIEKLPASHCPIYSKKVKLFIESDSSNCEKKVMSGVMVANLIVIQKINMNSEGGLYLTVAELLKIFKKNLDKDTEGRLVKSNYKIIKKISF